MSRAPLDPLPQAPGPVVGEGSPLEERLGEPMPPAAFLDLAVAVVGAVREVHEAGRVHEEVRPASLLVSADGRRVTLVGAGRVTGLDTSPGIELVSARLPYMAPEQTGRMNRSVDARSDLYAVGVVLYRMLTGELPFAAGSPLEWVHAHIARRPVPPAERLPGVSETLSAIVTRLLAKNAEERYQTAAGVEADLRRCRDELAATGAIGTSSLGEDDLPSRLRIPERLYGRERELRELAAAQDRVVRTGRSEVIVVSGPGGVGKSALVRELAKDAGARRALFAAGKFDQAHRDVPFATVGETFGGLVRGILRHGEEEVASWSRAIRDAVGRSGRVVAELVPELEWLVGPQPEVPELGPTEARNRLHAVFRRFLQAVATPEHPLVLLVDDLQWADPASLALLEHLATRDDLGHVLLIGIHRSDEVGPTHPLHLALTRLRRAGVALREIELEPLSSADVLRLVADATRQDEPDAVRLAGLVHRKTGGNPFFVRQFLAAIADDGLLALDRSRRAWVADVGAVAAQGVTDNVGDWMAGKLLRLSAPGLETLKRLACLGHEAPLATVAAIEGRPEDEVAGDLEELLETGLLTRLDGAVRFAHDRVQEAAYALIPAEDRPDRHLAIGRALLAALPTDAVDERIFELVDHLDRGAERIEDPAELRALYALHVRAGRRARAAVAHAAAHAYLTRARELLPADAWRERYAETLDVHLALLECELVAGSPERAQALFAELRRRAASELDHAEILRRWMLLHHGMGRIEEALALGLEALALLGVVFPTSRDEIHAAYRREHERLRERLAGRPIADLERLPVATDPRARAVMAILAVAGACAYNARQALTPLIYCTALHTALDRGNTPATCMTYISYGSSLVSRGDVDGAAAFAELALRLNARFADLERRGTLLYVKGAHVDLFRRHMATSLPLLEEGFRVCQEVGDLVFANFNASAVVTVLAESGLPLDELLRRTRRYAAFARESRNEAVEQWILAARQLARCLRGATSAPAGLDDEEFSETASLELMGRARFYTGVANLHLTRLEAAVFHGRWEEALAAAERCAATVNALRSGPREVSYHFFHALVLAALHPEADAERRRALEAELAEKEARLAFWAEHCPEGYGHRHTLVRAEIAAIEGRDVEAMRLYDAAIAAAAAEGFVQLEGLGSELAARFHRRRGLDRAAALYRAGARDAYARWGATALVDRLDREEGAPATVGDVPRGAAGTRLEHLDLAAVLEASRAVSNEIVLDRLVEKLLEIALEGAGADRGLLLLGDDPPRVVAEAAPGPDAVSVDRGQRPATSDALPLSVLGYVLRTRERVLVDDAEADHPFAEDEYFRARPRPRSVLCLPLLQQTHLVGVLYLENRLTPGAFTADRAGLLAVLASQAAISLENATLYGDLRREQAATRELNATLEQRVEERTADLHRALGELERARDLLARLAFVDGLTGIANRRGFDDALEREWRRAARADAWLSVVLVDLDWFKAVNDGYGHARGDEYLRAVADALAGVVTRPGDLAARYGGEELALLLPDTDPAGTRQVMDRLLTAVRNLALPNAGSPHGHLTASTGGVTLRPARGGTPKEALEHADRALYAAKAQGRNRAEHHDTETGTTTWTDPAPAGIEVPRTASRH